MSKKRNNNQENVEKLFQSPAGTCISLVDVRKFSASSAGPASHSRAVGSLERYRGRAELCGGFFSSFSSHFLPFSRNELASL